MFTGWEEGSEKFSSLVETEDSVENFAEKALKFLIFYGFDGVSLRLRHIDRPNFMNLFTD